MFANGGHTIDRDFSYGNPSLALVLNPVLVGRFLSAAFCEVVMLDGGIPFRTRRSITIG